MPPPPQRHRLRMLRRRPAAAAVLALIVAGCAAIPLEVAAPTVSPGVLDSAAAQGASAQDVQHGRDVVIARCGECHRLQPPASRTPEQWRRILPRMARRARLSPDDARCVEAYILAARAPAGTSPADQAATRTPR